ncbi:MAG: iron-containing alcohol dehydrogenase, partial [Clostridiales bacterium]|nr:iron-containing alcohol dehydrogenase [Clostridiales bacterium]
AAVNDGGISAVGETALAAFQSGVAIANAGVGAVHALASGIGAYTDLPHGLICGILLPRVMEINLSYSLKKYAEIGRILTGGDGRDSEMAESAVKAVRGLAGALGIPNSFRSAGESGIADIAEAVVDACADGGSMQSNPRPFERQVWVDLLKKFK